MYVCVRRVSTCTIFISSKRTVSERRGAENRSKTENRCWTAKSKLTADVLSTADSPPPCKRTKRRFWPVQQWNTGSSDAPTPSWPARDPLSGAPCQRSPSVASRLQPPHPAMYAQAYVQELLGRAEILSISSVHLSIHSILTVTVCHSLQIVFFFFSKIAPGHMHKVGHPRQPLTNPLCGMK